MISLEQQDFLEPRGIQHPPLAVAGGHQAPLAVAGGHQAPLPGAIHQGKKSIWLKEKAERGAGYKQSFNCLGTGQIALCK